MRLLNFSDKGTAEDEDFVRHSSRHWKVFKGSRGGGEVAARQVKWKIRERKSAVSEHLLNKTPRRKVILRSTLFLGWFSDWVNNVVRRRGKAEWWFGVRLVGIFCDKKNGSEWRRKKDELKTDEQWQRSLLISWRFNMKSTRITKLQSVNSMTQNLH